MTSQGWTLYTYVLFDQQLAKLEEKVRAAAKAEPAGYKGHPATKLLATIHKYISELIPANPNAPHFRLGNTLGKDNRHWFRAKFHDRYRLFYRFSTKDKVIIYCWINDESTPRKRRSSSDPYTVFQSLLKSGTPPATLDQLIASSRKLK